MRYPATDESKSDSLMASLAEEGSVHDTLVSVLHVLAQTTPDSDFLVEDIDQSLTYSQFYTLASQILPSRLHRLCPALSRPRSRKVVLLTPNNSLFPLTVWALWFMSFSVVPISVKSEQSVWGAMVKHVDPDAVIISSTLKEVVAQHLDLPADLDVAYLENIIPTQFSLGMSSTRQSDFIPSLVRWLSQEIKEKTDVGVDACPCLDPKTPVISLFTSSAVDASTVKSVTYTHEILVQSGRRMIEMLGGDEYGNLPVRHLGWLSLSHCFEFCITLIGTVLQTGGTYIFFDREVSSPDAPLSTPLHIQLLRAIDYHQPVDALCLVPAIFADMVRDLDPSGLRNLKALRSLGVGGAPTAENIFQWAAEEGIPYFDCSGATEVAGTICIRRATVESMRTYGLQVAPGLEGFLEKESLDDNFGELVVRGAFIPSGYDNRNSSSYLRDPTTGMTIYRTGDLYGQHVEMGKAQTWASYLKGESLPEREADRPQLSGLKYIGRIDDMVVLASGVKIDALALERRLNEIPLISRSAVVTDMSRETPVVLVQPTSESDSRKHEEIVRSVLGLNRTLSFDKRIRPENVIIVDELPVTTKFTINRKKIRKIWTESNGKWPGTKSGVNASDINEHDLCEQDLLRAEIRTTVENLLSDIFDIPVDHFARQSVHFSEIPLTSMSSVQLARALESRFSIRISAAQLYSLKSVDDICDLVVAFKAAVEQEGNLAQDRDSVSSDTIQVSPVNAEDSSLVITGAACRYPGRLRSLDDLWDALLDPKTYVKSVSKTAPRSRWDSDPEQIPPIAWLEDDNFDNLSSFRDFFSLSPSDAESMSPNARLVLQLGYQAIEDAGIAPKSLDGQAWGVFTSVNNSGWRERRSAECELEDYSASLLGSADDAVGARLSYFLNLTGPAIEIKTACSSSAVGVHQACSAIRNGDCDAAIVISSTTHFHPSGPIFRSKAGIASKLGRCATFSEEADGFLPGEGAAAIVIQRAADAHSAPYVSIKATHVSQDGRSHGFFAPNPAAQTRLLHQTLKKAFLSEQDIDFIETHGTGTQLGDAVEMQALDKVFRGKRARPLMIGAVKAVVGHTEENAGLTSVLKSLLCLRNSIIPAQPNFIRPNSQIDFGSSKFSVPRRIVSLPRTDRPRRVGISSFGLSGTLAHIILEDFDDSRVPRSSPAPNLFLLSAHDREGYESLLERYLNFSLSPYALDADFKAICRTSQVARDHLTLRRAWFVHDHFAWTTAISNELRNPRPRRRLRSGTARLGIWFGLPVHGKSVDIPEYPTFDHERAIVACGGWDNRYGPFAQQLILANILKALGCEIAAVGGEGMAEWVAGVYAGVLPMSSVFQAPKEEDTEAYLIEGPKEQLTEILTEFLPSEFALRGSLSQDLHVFEGTADAAKEFAELAEVTLSSVPALAPAAPPEKIISFQATPFVSGHLAEVLDKDMIGNLAYWARTASRYFDSSQGLESLAAQCDVVLHIGGSKLDMDSERYIHFDSERFEEILGSLYERGCDIDWARFGSDGQRLHLPVYQW